jgi:hypothetical protein
MPGRGPAPKANSRTRHKPIRGSWSPAPGSGWQHGDTPPPPAGLMPQSAEVWETWFRSWWASNWTPEYMPQIETTIRLYDDVVRGNLKSATELRQHMDGIGATFKGQQDRRWQPPKADAVPVAETVPAPGGRFAHLRAVG